MATRNLPSQEYESDGDSYENRVFAHSSGPMVEKYSVATQIVMGGVRGWCAGVLFQKARKLAATAVGGGFLLLQIAGHGGCVQIDWRSVEKDHPKSIIEEATEFVRQNTVVSSGFVGGFLLGLAS
ncbi:hypothetical protein FD754_010464 [Muntiacus muntjak]|uniref:FUN14 domain-containing protein 1 n=1 Tax=Muntiacus muntjak TaxID=9888 RepID=A0A5N3WZK0_MUNMU|nr:hypothetical protein FD754_010464 [Muntiacus muntjak]